MPRLLSIVVAALLTASAWATLPARAQETRPTVALHLLRHPPSHGPDDGLGLRLRVYNRGPETLSGFSIQLAAFDRVATRSALQQSFEGVTPGIAAVRSVYPTDFFDETVSPGSAMTVTIDERVSRSLLSLAQATEGGVFPVTVSLLDADLSPLDSLTTQFVHLPQPPETPLGIAVVLPLVDLPSRGPDGTFVVDSTGTVPLEAAIAPGGWLHGLLDALDRWTDAARRSHARITLAPLPRLLEELDAMGQGYPRARAGSVIEEVDRDDAPARAARRTLDRLAALVARDDIELVLSPYSFPDLSALGARLSPETATEHILRQVSEASAVVEQTLDTEIDREWLYPPGGRVDRRALDLLRQLNFGAKTFVWNGALERPQEPADAGCPAAFASYTCPVVIDTVEGRTLALGADEGLTERANRLARSEDGGLDVQRLFAETAMIWAELPGTAGRITHVALPPLWHPSPRTARDVLRGLARSPWLHTMTASEALAHGTDAVEQQAEGLDAIVHDIQSELAPFPSEPSTSYFTNIARSEAVVESFRSVKPPAPIGSRLRRNLLVAESRLWWTDADLIGTGARYATDARREAEYELAKIGVQSPDEITLTSRQGSVQLLVLNGTGYPVDLRLSLASTKLSFENDEITRTFEPATTPVAVVVTAQSSGIFPLEVALETPDGRRLGPGAEKAISVRSTELNQIAVAVTVGALVFLVLFYMTRVIRSRRAREEAVGAPNP